MPELKDEGSGWEWAHAGEMGQNPGRSGAMSKNSQALLSEHHPCRAKWEDIKPTAGEGKISRGLTHHSKELRLYIADGENHTRVLNLYFQQIILASRWQGALK